MTKSPKVSVIIPTFNGATFLFDTLLSVQNQYFQDWEATIVVDGSTDNTVEFFRNSNFNSDSRFKLVVHKNTGVSHSRNVGIASSKSEFIAFLDHDDIWHPSKLSEQLRFMYEHPQFSACLTWYLTSTHRRGRLNHRALFSYQNVDSMIQNWLTLTGNGPLMPSTMLVKRNHVGNLFSETLNAIGDLDFTSRFGASNTLGVLQLPLVLYVQHKNQMHTNASSIEDYRLYYSNIPKNVVLKYSLNVSSIQSKVDNHINVIRHFDDFKKAKNVKGKLRALRESGLWRLSVLRLLFSMLRKRLVGFTARLMYWRMISRLWNT